MTARRKTFFKNGSALIAFLIFFIFWIPGLFGASKIISPCQLNRLTRYSVMRPSKEQFLKWIHDYQTAPIYKPSRRAKIPAPRGSVSLLDKISYVASERDQGSCGNCWAWAGTGCLEVALNVQTSTKDRLSVQYINSCETSVISKDRCDGGWLSDFANFYNSTKKAIPWSNTNAEWQDGDLSYETTCAMIGTSPNYPIETISYDIISTQGVTQTQAITNIKNALGDDKAVWFAFFLPNQTAWENFQSFWADNTESTVYEIDKYVGEEYDFVTGAGHAVLCVGYNDDDPDNSYWILLNSWGTNTNRTNGLFRINMDMNYSGQNSSYYSFYWQVLDVDFGTITGTIVLSDRTSGSTSLTDERTVNFNITPEGSPDEMILSEKSDFSDASWQTYSASGTFTLSEGYGAKTVYLKLKQGTTESSSASASITYADSSTPIISSFALKDSSTGSTQYTNKDNVTANISASNATEMKISEDPTFSVVSWQTYNGSSAFSLSSGDGQKTVYLKVHNIFSTESSVASAQIILDTTAPTIQAKADNNLILNNDMIKNSFQLLGLFTETYEIDPDSIKIYLDNSLVTDGSHSSGHYDTYDPATKIVAYNLRSTLSTNTHSLKIEANDKAANTGLVELTGLRVLQTLQLDDLYNFPNPTSGTTKFSYQLSQPADVLIKIFTTRGRLVKTLTATKNSSGGQTGFNTISWNSRDEAGNLLPNDAYIYLITVNDGQSKIIKRGRLAILK
jgi:C1A family cysteine protease